MILVESNGHFGLIDTSNRESSSFTLNDGTVVSVPASSSLSNPTWFKNGKTIAEYMKIALGVKHLDFILITHSHSDHIGGVDEICTNSGLVDKNTVYFYKQYHSINEKNDVVWHNVDYYQKSIEAVSAKKAIMVDVSKPDGYQIGVKTTNGKQPSFKFSDAIAKINSASGLRGAKYVQGDRSNWHDDYIQFTFGNFYISLYNIFSNTIVEYADENVNSICALIQMGNTKVVSLGDINDENGCSNKVARAISDRVGKIDLLKPGHHGATSYSNTKIEADCYQPTYVVRTGTRDESLMNSWACYVTYCKKKYGTKFYTVADAKYAVVAELSYTGLKIKQLAGTTVSPTYIDPVPYEYKVAKDGWNWWDLNASGAYGADSCLWYYFENGVAKTGWIYKTTSNGKNAFWYYLDEYGLMAHGFQKVKNKLYYLAADQPDGNRPQGRMLTGWVQVEDAWYYFDKSGALVRAWRIPEGGTYYMSGDGSPDMERGWVNVYFDGAKTWFYAIQTLMFTGWRQIDGQWYYFDETGIYSHSWK